MNLRLSLALILLFPFTGFSQLSHNKFLIADNYDDPSSPFIIDLNEDGHLDFLSVGANNHDVTWWENDGSVSFTQHTINGSFTFPYAIVGADIDQDGDFDLVAGSWWQDRISWWSNDGSENFTQSDIVTGYNGAWGINTADVNNDGNIDILGTAHLGDELTWFENDGNENFTSHTIDANMDGAFQINSIDLDSDGDMDIVGIAFSQMEIAYYLNDGAEVFTKVVLDADIAPQQFSLLDLGDDGDMDIFVASSSDGLVLYEDTTSSLEYKKIIVDAGFNGKALVAIDYDNDLDVDIIASSNFIDELAFYENDGSNTFTKNIIDDDLIAPSTLAVGDLDSDGDLDIILGDDNTDEIYWYEQFQNTDSPPCTQLNYPINGDDMVPVDTTLYWDVANTALGYKLVIGSCNTCNDILDTLDLGNVTQHSIVGMPFESMVYVEIIPYNTFGETHNCDNDSFVTLPAAPVCTSLSSPENGSTQVEVTASLHWDSVAEAEGYFLDIGTCETCQDLANHIDTASDTTYSIGYWPDSTWIFTKVSPYNNGGEAINCVVDSFFTSARPICVNDFMSEELFNFGTKNSIISDLDSDGDNDILVPNSLISGIKWYENDGNGNFTDNDINGTMYQDAIYAVDLDLDGDMDIVTGGSTEIGWYSNDGNNQFTYNTILTFDDTNHIVVQDMNADGHLDIVVVGNNGFSTAGWLENDGTQNFTFAYFPIGLTSSSFIVFDVDDLDGDGLQDVLVPDFGEDVIHYVKNNGSGNFTNTDIEYNNATFPRNIDVADRDMDGDNDIVIAETGIDQIIILINDGNENFSELVLDADADGARQVIFNDFDLDGDSDIIALNVGTNEVVNYININNEFCKSILFDSLQIYSEIALGDLGGDGLIDILLNISFPDKTILIENENTNNSCASIENGDLTIYSCDGLFYDPELNKGIEYSHGNLFEDYIKSGLPFHKMELNYTIGTTNHSAHNSSASPAEIEIETTSYTSPTDSAFVWFGMTDDFSISRSVSITSENEILLSSEICNQSGDTMLDLYFGEIMDFDNLLGCNTFSFYTDVVGSSISMNSVCNDNYDITFGSFDSSIIFSANWGPTLELEDEFNAPSDPDGTLVDGGVTAIKYIPTLSDGACIEVDIQGIPSDSWTTLGCTDISAHNYDPNANTDDGSCLTCNDGLLNGDETDIDCGGNICDLCIILGADCPNTLDLLGESIQEGLYKADQTIISNNILQNSINTRYEAGSQISLEPQFEIPVGVEFEVLIKNCVPD